MSCPREESRSTAARGTRAAAQAARRRRGAARPRGRVPGGGAADIGTPRTAVNRERPPRATRCAESDHWPDSPLVGGESSPVAYPFRPRSKRKTPQRREPAFEGGASAGRYRVWMWRITPCWRDYTISVARWYCFGPGEFVAWGAAAAGTALWAAKLPSLRLSSGRWRGAATRLPSDSSGDSAATANRVGSARSRLCVQRCARTLATGPGAPSRVSVSGSHDFTPDFFLGASGDVLPNSWQPDTH